MIEERDRNVLIRSSTNAVKRSKLHRGEEGRGEEREGKETAKARREERKVCELLTSAAFYLCGVSGYKVMCAVKDIHAQARRCRREFTCVLSVTHTDTRTHHPPQSAMEYVCVIITHH